MNSNSERYNITMDALITSMKAIMPFMQDKNVFEVYVNPDGKIWTDSLDKGRSYTGKNISPEDTRGIILNVAALTDQLIKAERPALDADIPSNSFFPKCRFEGNLPGIVASPTLNIRKHPETIFSLQDYVKQGTLTEKQYDFLVEAIHQKKNIIAAGGTKSGKTTFLNAILAEISKLDDRVILIEDTPELQCSAEDCVQMRATDTFPMEDCLRQVLRMTPDRIVVGEVRSGEALALLDAWSTGHGGGCSTVHSNSAVDTLLRLENMTARVSRNPQQATIAQAVHYIVYLKYIGNTRKVQEILELEHWDPASKKYIYHEVT
jgi:P-type conjugative transfer ATPase trbB